MLFRSSAFLYLDFSTKLRHRFAFGFILFSRTSNSISRFRAIILSPRLSPHARLQLRLTSTIATMDDVPDEPDLMSDTDTDSYSETDSCESESGGEVIVQTSDSEEINEDVAASHDHSASELSAVPATVVIEDDPPALVQENGTVSEPEPGQSTESADVERDTNGPRPRADSIPGSEIEPIPEFDGRSRSPSLHGNSDSSREAPLKPSIRRRRRIKTKTIADHKTAGR